MAGLEKQKVIPININGFEINAQNVTFQKLQEFTLTLFEQLSFQRKERSFLTLERDKLRTILENTLHDVKVTNAITATKVNELDQVQNNYNQELKEIQQEVKYILYDQNIHLSELNLWEKDLKEKTETNNFEEELELLQEKMSLKHKFSEQNITNENELKNIKNKHLEEIENLKQKQEEVKIKKELESKTNYNTTIEHFNLKHEMEMSEIEERKNTHLSQLKLINRRSMDEMKVFFNSISSENLTVISNLKQSLESLKKSKGLISDEVKLLKKENKKLQTSLNSLKVKVENLKTQQIHYEKDIVSLKSNKFLLNRIINDTKDVRAHSAEALRKIKEEKIVDAIEQFNSKLFSSMNSFSNSADRRKHYMQQLISTLIYELIEKQKIINEISSDPDIYQVLSELKYEYWNPQKLSYELAVMCKAHDDLLKTLCEKLQEFHVPEDEFEMNPLLDITMIGKSPSSFTSKQ